MKPQHIRTTYSGVLGTPTAPVEHWSYSLSGPYQDWTANDDAFFDDLAWGMDYAWGKANSLQDMMPSDVVLTECRIALIGADGKTKKRADGSYLQGVIQTETAGIQATQGAPAQQALCVSLTTARQGATGKGRFFLPWPALSLDHTDKRLPVAQAESARDKIAVFLAEHAVRTTVPIHVVSSKGYTSAVTGFRLGRAPDTLRSRREDVPEGYVNGTF